MPRSLEEREFVDADKPLSEVREEIPELAAEQDSEPLLDQDSEPGIGLDLGSEVEPPGLDERRQQPERQQGGRPRQNNDRRHGGGHGRNRDNRDHSNSPYSGGRSKPVLMDKHRHENKPDQERNFSQLFQ